MSVSGVTRATTARRPSGEGASGRGHGGRGSGAEELQGGPDDDVPQRETTESPERLRVPDPRTERHCGALRRARDLCHSRAHALVIERPGTAEIDAQVGRPDERDVEPNEKLAERIDGGRG